MNRSLSPVEQTIYRVDRASPLNFTTVARIRGPLTAAALGQAITAVRNRHPLLRMRIVEGGDDTVVFRDDAPPPSLRAVAGGDWIAEAEREVNEPLPAATGPLARCVLIEHAHDDHTLLITLHHAIGDGMSGAYLVRDLVQAASVAIGGVTPSLPPLPLADAVDQRFPASVRGFAGKWLLLRFMLREMLVMLRHGKPVRVRRDKEAFAHQRRARLLHRTLDKEFIARLTARARAENTTVHGALSAAILLAVLHDAGRKTLTRVTFGSPVNVRTEIEPPAGEETGFYVSMLPFNGPVDPQASIWHVARQVREDMNTERARLTPLVALGGMGLAFRLLIGKHRERAALCERWETMIPTTSGLTNLGRLDIATKFGALEISALHFLAAPSALGDFLSTATSLHGALLWNFVWTDPVFTEAHVEALVDDMVDRLQTAVESPSC